MSNPILLLYPVVDVIVTALSRGGRCSRLVRREPPVPALLVCLIEHDRSGNARVCVDDRRAACGGPGCAFFRIYYIFGASLVPAWLGGTLLWSPALASYASV